MAIQLKNTNDVHLARVKALVYGQAGAGKTTLATTMPKPIIISAESGLLSIAGSGVDYIEVSNMQDLYEAFEWVNSTEGDRFESVVLDSLSEIGEVVLSFEKQRTVNGKLVDPRQAYGSMQDQMGSLIRSFRDLPKKHVLMTAKLEKTQDEMGRVLYAPSMPGNKMAQQIPFFFDAVFALRVEKDAEGNTQRALMCDSDGLWQAKCRINGVSAWEAPDMGAIIDKVKGV